MSLPTAHCSPASTPSNVSRGDSPSAIDPGKADATTTTPFVEVSKVLEFFLDDQGEPQARFIATDDQRSFPLKHLVIQAQLHQAIIAAKEDPTRQSMDCLRFECVRAATGKFRTKTERDLDLLEDDELVVAIVNFLARLTKQKKNAKFTGTITELRKHLVEVPAEERAGSESWPKFSHFARYVRARQEALKCVGITLTWRHLGSCREYTLAWCNESAGLKHVKLTDPDDLFELTGRNDPQLVQQTRAVTAGDAQKQTVASPVVTASDGPEKKVVSPPTPKRSKRGATERVGCPSAAQPGSGVDSEMIEVES